MDYSIRFAQAHWLYYLLPLIALGALFVYAYKKQVAYKYSLGSFLAKSKARTNHPYKKILNALRVGTLCALAISCARPQLVDSRSEITVEGIPMILALDVSASMQTPDMDGEQRIVTAIREAKKYVQQRPYDAMGLVIFANDAISRCPITHDKKLLTNILDELTIGLIDERGTHLSTALITAASRLKHLEAKSKVIILLTDGEPSEGDANPDIAIQIAQQMGIRVYTIGIGQDKPWQYAHPLFGVITVPPTINSPLLKKIAQETNGQFFLAHTTQDMRTIYDTIDGLEKSEIATPIFNNFYELGFLGMALALVLICLEIFLSTFIWFSL